jgi:hypothetical protein
MFYTLLLAFNKFTFHGVWMEGQICQIYLSWCLDGGPNMVAKAFNAQGRERGKMSIPCRPNSKFTPIYPSCGANRIERGKTFTPQSKEEVK